MICTFINVFICGEKMIAPKLILNNLANYLFSEFDFVKVCIQIRHLTLNRYTVHILFFAFGIFFEISFFFRNFVFFEMVCTFMNVYIWGLKMTAPKLILQNLENYVFFQLHFVKVCIKMKHLTLSKYILCIFCFSVLDFFLTFLTFCHKICVF